MKTPGVSIEQARAFHSKLWQMHIDSQRMDISLSAAAMSQISNTTQSFIALGYSSPTDMLSSRDPHSKKSVASFKDHIRPGMVISWKKPSRPGSKPNEPESLSLAAVLCPAEVARKPDQNNSNHSTEAQQSEHDEVADTEHENGSRYICALISPGLMHGAYELSLWRQLIVDVDMMEKEVILEYDTATRYYFISV